MAKRDYITCDGCDEKLIYDGYDVARDTFDEAKPPLLLCGNCAATRREIDDAKGRLIRAALRFDSCMAEFEGDPAACGGHLDDLYSACDALRKNPLKGGA